jgi:transcriptional regulator with XRE-family HTH domain
MLIDTSKVSDLRTEPVADDPWTDKTAGFGLVVKNLRTMRGVTQHQLAKKTGYNRPTIGNLETGLQTMTTVQFMNILNALGIELKMTFSDAFIKGPSE